MLGRMRQNKKKVDNLKIALIYGQSHHGSTYHIARRLAEKLAGEAGTITEFFLPRDFGDFCTGCTACFMRSETLCPHYEKLAPITAAMDAADVIILASPVYVYHVTGAMKAFLDHYGWRWMVHRPEAAMFGKQAVCIATAAGSGTKSTLQDMAHSTFFWGVAKTYRWGLNVRATKWTEIDGRRKAKIEGEITRLAQRIKRDQKHLHPGMKTKAFFNLMRFLQRRGWNAADLAYWHEKGWDGSARPWRRG